jgi:methylated-DNA-[protein]-cysteine S-methyltransferase
VRYRVVDSPIGELMLSGDDGVLRGLAFMDSDRAPSVNEAWVRDESAFGDVATQLEAYFNGELTRFDLKLASGGTPFQQRVWSALQEIPYGTTTTYGRLAEQLGDPKSVRAVGLANGRNPIAIIIPCHRVIGADGGLVGYGGGMTRKRWLLAHEAGEGRLPW